MDGVDIKTWDTDILSDGGGLGQSSVFTGGEGMKVATNVALSQLP